MTLNTFIAAVGEKAITAMLACTCIFPHKPTEGENKCRLTVLPTITRDWLLRHHPTRHAFMGLVSRAYVMSRDGAGLCSGRIKYMRRFQIHRITYARCIEYVHSLAVSHRC
ncbi:hypothetical protein TNCV_2311911 [Trichonephila clavipes]|nr:hypothetical protein TNCV_2311911 [Trichonephila clavipes]